MELSLTWRLCSLVEVLAFPEPPADRQLPGAPCDEVATSADLSPELSPPRSPQLKSTVRDQPRYHLVAQGHAISPPPPTFSWTL